ncbi:MAG: glycosyltransferase, partial [Actinobacteria bacterium]|nr:glycosyltransferase [Actinomycetota bacterium]
MSDSTPIVSGLLAVRDGRRYLDQAVQSLLRQTLAEVELLVVDDASTDDTPELLARIRDPRLTVFRNETRRGLASSLNLALDNARGRYVARLDADDVAMPDRLERQLAHMRAHPEVAVLGSAVLDVDDQGRVGGLHEMPRGFAEVRWSALFSSPHFHPTVLVDRDVLERHGFRYDVGFEESEDYDLWTRLLAVAEGDNLPEPLVLYRVHAGQASQRRRPLQREFQERVALREIGRVAPDLTRSQAELAWRVGSLELVAAEQLEDAAEAFVALVRAFERDGYSGIRKTAARRLARCAASARGPARTAVLARALRLDPAVAGHLAVDRWQRRRTRRSVQRHVDAWLAQLDTAGEGARPIRVAAVFPEPTPYRAPLLDRIGARDEVDLTVIYAAATVAGRTWTVEPRHRSVYLRGVRIPGAERVLHHDYPVTPGVARALERVRPEVVVVSGWSTFAAQGAIAWCRMRGVPYALVVESHDEGPRAGWRRQV